MSCLFEFHLMNDQNNNANKSLGFVRRNLKSKNTSFKSLKAYKAIVRPQLEYAAPVWDPHTKEDIKRIESVQRWAAHWVYMGITPHTQASRT